MAVAQAVQVVTATESESMQCVKALVRLSVHTVCHTRGLFGEDAFLLRNGFAGLNNMHELKRDYSDESATILRWIEQGVDDALNHKVLKTMIFSISAATDTPIPDVLEQYEFEFAYSQGAVGVSSRVLGLRCEAVATPALLKKQAGAVVRQLVTAVSTLSCVPEDRILSMHFIYNDSVQADYEPPGFVAANADSLGSFARAPTCLPFGGVRSDHHTSKVAVRSLLDSLEETPYSQCGRSMAVAQEDGQPSQSDARGVFRQEHRVATEAAQLEGCDSDATQEEEEEEAGAAMPPRATALKAPPASKSAKVPLAPPPAPPQSRPVRAAAPVSDVTAKMAGLASKKRDAAEAEGATCGWQKRPRGKMSAPAQPVVQRKGTADADDVFSAAFL